MSRYAVGDLVVWRENNDYEFPTTHRRRPETTELYKREFWRGPFKIVGVREPSPASRLISPQFLTLEGCGSESLSLHYVVPAPH